MEHMIITELYNDLIRIVAENGYELVCGDKVYSEAVIKTNMLRKFTTRPDGENRGTE